MAFLPSDVSGLRLWLDAEDASTLDSPEGLTYSWADKSGSGNDPVIQAGKPLGIHNSPTGSSTRILRIVGQTGTGYLRIDSVAPLINSPFTLFLVAAFPTNGSGNLVLAGAGHSGTVTPTFALQRSSNKYNITFRSASGATVAPNSTADANSDVAIFTVQYSGSTVALRRNGIQIASANYSGGNDCNQFGIGILPRNTLTNPCDTLVAEVLLYDSSLSTADRDTIEAYLQRHLSADTIYRSFPSFWTAARTPKLARFTKTGNAYDSTYHAGRNRYSSPSGLYHVDPVSGNDANAGTSLSPLKSINAALAKPDVCGVSLAAGVYHRNAAWSTFVRPERSACVFCPAGQAVICDAEEISHWTKTSGLSDVYEFTRSASVMEVFDLTHTDDDGRAVSFSIQSSANAVDTHPGSYFDDGTKVYVRTFDSRAADRDVVVRLGTVTPTFPFTTGGRFLSIENVTFYHATGLPDVAGSVLYFDNVRGYGGGEWSFTNTDEAYFHECVRTNVDDDLLDYRGDILGVEVGCVLQSNGVADSSNTSTAHGSATVIRLNGQYRGGCRTNHDIEQTMNWYIACEIRNSLAGGDQTNVGIAAGDLGNVASTAKTCVERCRFSGHATDFAVGNGALLQLIGVNPRFYSLDEHANGTFETLEVPLPAGAIRKRATSRYGISL